MRIRHAVDDDHDAYTRLFTELAVPEAPPPRDRFVSSMRKDVLLAEDDEGVVGLVWARARGGLWHIVHLMSDPRHRRRRVGRALLLAAAARGRSLGHQRWMLNVKPEDVVARALYESVGMVEVMASAVVKLGWRDVERLPAADGVVVGPVADGVDAVPALQLLPGELAAARSLPGRWIMAEQAIRQAERRGDLDHLPGKGKPLALDALGLDEDARLDATLRQTTGGADLELDLRKEAARLREALTDPASTTPPAPPSRPPSPTSSCGCRSCTRPTATAWSPTAPSTSCLAEVVP